MLLSPLVYAPDGIRYARIEWATTVDVSAGAGSVNLLSTTTARKSDELADNLGIPDSTALNSVQIGIVIFALSISIVTPRYAVDTAGTATGFDPLATDAVLDGIRVLHTPGLQSVQRSIRAADVLQQQVAGVAIASSSVLDTTIKVTDRASPSVSPRPIRWPPGGIVPIRSWMDSLTLSWRDFSTILPSGASPDFGLRLRSHAVVLDRTKAENIPWNDMDRGFGPGCRAQSDTAKKALSELMASVRAGAETAGGV